MIQATAKQRLRNVNMGCTSLQPAVVAAAAVLLLAATAVTAAAPPPTVTTTGGAVTGELVGGDVGRWLGIPYAQPPLGDLRFAPPQPAAPWRETLNATDAGPACQQKGGLGMYPFPPLDTFSEDCLRLNVFAPWAARGQSVRGIASRPVLVWLHGGGFTGGSGYTSAFGDLETALNVTAIYDAVVLARSTGAVIVTINYRLGAFGFLASPADNSTGNAGLMDQRMALRWARDNAAAFGGNPAQVTLFGESAGAASVLYHLVSPRSAHLFRAGIVESGYFKTRRPADAYPRTDSFMKKIGCSGDATGKLACARAADASAVVHAGGTIVAAPLITGTAELPDDPKSLLAQGRFNRGVPIIIGNNRDEEAILSTDCFLPMSMSEAEAQLASMFGARAPAVMQLYPLASFPEPRDAVQRISSAYLQNPRKNLSASPLIQ